MISVCSLCLLPHLFSAAECFERQISVAPARQLFAICYIIPISFLVISNTLAIAKISFEPEQVLHAVAISERAQWRLQTLEIVISTLPSSVVKAKLFQLVVN